MLEIFLFFLNVYVNIMKCNYTNMFSIVGMAIVFSQYSCGENTNSNKQEQSSTSTDESASPTQTVGDESGAGSQLEQRRKTYANVDNGVVRERGKIVYAKKNGVELELTPENIAMLEKDEKERKEKEELEKAEKLKIKAGDLEISIGSRIVLIWHSQNNCYGLAPFLSIVNTTTEEKYCKKIVVNLSLIFEGGEKAEVPDYASAENITFTSLKRIEVKDESPIELDTKSKFAVAPKKAKIKINLVGDDALVIHTLEKEVDLEVK